MKKLVKILPLLLSLMLVAKVLYAAPPVYTEKQTHIIVTVNQPQFIIKLKSNPTTGYIWTLYQYNKEFVKKIKNCYVPSVNGDKLVGVSGVELWTFALTPLGLQRAKNTEIRFAYRRLWESQSPVKQIVFKVTSQAR